MRFMADATGTDLDEWHLWRMFRRAQARLDRRIDGQLHRDSDLGLGEYGAIAAILESADLRLRVGEIARELGWEKSRASHLVSRLQGKGWLERDASHDDGRAAYVSVTSAGRREYLGAIRGHAAEVRAAFLDHVDLQEREMLARVLQRIVDADS